MRTKVRVRASSSRKRLAGAIPAPAKSCSGRESNRNCVAARRGGEQRNERMQTIMRMNLIRPPWVPSLRPTERRQACAGHEPESVHPTVKRNSGRMEVGVDSMHSKTEAMKMRELTGKAESGSPLNYRSDRLTNRAILRAGLRPSEVRVPIVARKPGNADGAMGGRKTNGGHP